MEESNKTKFVDLYLKWNEQGQLKVNLQVISMLVKSGLTEKQIAKYYHVSIDNIKELKKKSMPPLPKRPSSLSSVCWSFQRGW